MEAVVGMRQVEGQHIQPPGLTYVNHAHAGPMGRAVHLDGAGACRSHTYPPAQGLRVGGSVPAPAPGTGRVALHDGRTLAVGLPPVVGQWAPQRGRGTVTVLCACWTPTALPVENAVAD
jgi:hypothetical protein